MKYTITIEEICDRDFSVEAKDCFEAINKAIMKYRKNEFSIDRNKVSFRQIASTGIEPTEWMQFYNEGDLS